MTPMCTRSKWAWAQDAGQVAASSAPGPQGVSKLGPWPNASTPPHAPHPKSASLHVKPRGSRGLERSRMLAAGRGNDHKQRALTVGVNDQTSQSRLHLPQKVRES